MLTVFRGAALLLPIVTSILAQGPGAGRNYGRSMVISQQGIVAVRDFTKQVTLNVRAGQSYLARPPA